jgi:hypothetical protein
VDPAATVTDEGVTTTPVGLVETVKSAPPAGAALERVTVQLVEAEAARVVLVHCSEVRVKDAVTVKAAVLLLPFSVAVTMGF